MLSAVCTKLGGEKCIFVRGTRSERVIRRRDCVVGVVARSPPFTPIYGDRDLLLGAHGCWAVPWQDTDQQHDCM